MPFRIQTGLLAVLALALAWSMKTQRAVVSEIDTLSERLVLLEKVSESSMRQSSSTDRGSSILQALQSQGLNANGSKKRGGRNASDTGSASAANGVELTEIPDAIRDELVEIVEEEQDNASEDRKEEWRRRFAEGMRSSVEEFVEDRGISDNVADQMRTLFEDGMSERMRLWQEMENEEISWYQMRKEMKSNREAWEDDMQGLLSEDDFQELLEIFPKRR